MNKNSNFKMFPKIIITTITIFVITIISLAGAFYYLSSQAIERDVKNDLKSTATLLSQMDLIQQTLEKEKINPELNKLLDDIVFQYINIDVITLADMNGVRLYHVDKNQIYKKFSGGDEEKVLHGESYFSVATGTQGPQYRYLTPVYSRGKQVGFILVSTLKKNFYNLKKDSIYKIACISGAILLMTVLLSILVYRSIKKSLLGYEPEQIVNDLILREEVMNGMDEGIIYVDTDNKIQLINNMARLMMNLPQADMDLEDIDVEKYLLSNDCVEKTDAVGNVMLQCRLNDIIYKQINILEKDKIIGTVYILTDKKLALKLAEELTGVNHIVTSLRANNHEFLNKLHVINGLIQSGNDKEALEYINKVSMIQQDVLSKILNLIKNKNIAALLLGKVSYAREREIQLHINSKSYLPPHSAFLSTYSLTTILGNLINNAIESLCAKTDHILEENIVSVYIRETPSELTVMIEDTGVGMDEMMVNKLSSGTYISKKEGHGIGYKLIKNVVDNAEGLIEIESEKDNGTNVTVIINKKRRGYKC